MEWIGPRLATAAPLPARLPNGCRVECDLRDHVQRHIFFQGAYEPIESYLFTRLVREGSTVVDAGANIGQYSMIASTAVGASGQVHSFEPVEINFRHLKQNVGRNRLTNIHLNQIALWNESTRVRLELPGGGDGIGTNNGQYSVNTSGNANDLGVTAQAVRLDDYAQEHNLGRIDLIKMDVEGAEWAALQGMAGIIQRDRPTLLMEVNRLACGRFGYEPNVFWEFLCRRFGYTAWQIGMSAEQWKKLTDANEISQLNVLFTPGDLPVEVATGWDFHTCLHWAGAGLWNRVDQ